MGNPQEPLENHNKYHGYTVRAAPNCPLTVGRESDFKNFLPGTCERPLFLAVFAPPTQGLFQSKQGSCGFQLDKETSVQGSESSVCSLHF